MSTVEHTPAASQHFSQSFASGDNRPQPFGLLVNVSNLLKVNLPLRPSPGTTMQTLRMRVPSLSMYRVWPTACLPSCTVEGAALAATQIPRKDPANSRQALQEPEQQCAATPTPTPFLLPHNLQPHTKPLSSTPLYHLRYAKGVFVWSGSHSHHNRKSGRWAQST